MMLFPALLAVHAHSIQIVPNPNPAGNTIDTPRDFLNNPPDVTAHNSIYFMNNGTVNFRAALMTGEFLTIMERWRMGFGRMTRSPRKYGGTGLGLSISRQILNLMGSDLKATSEPGHGNEFTFTIGFDYPMVDKAVLDFAAGPLPSVTMGGFPGVRVLLSEGNQINAEVAVEILKDAGASVIHAVSGREAVEIALTSPTTSSSWTSR